MTGAVDAQGRTAAWECNPFGEVTAETGFDPVTTAYQYDPTCAIAVSPSASGLSKRFECGLGCAG